MHSETVDSSLLGVESSAPGRGIASTNYPIRRNGRSCGVELVGLLLAVVWKALSFFRSCFQRLAAVATAAGSLFMSVYERIRTFFRQYFGLRRNVYPLALQMERFSDAVRALYPEKKDPQRVTEGLEFLATKKVEVVDGIEVSPVSRIPVKVSVIFQVGIRRMTELSNSAIRETNLQNLSSMCVIGRSAFETACLPYDVSLQVQKYVREGKPEAILEVDKYLVKTLLGHKAKAWALDPAIEATNILTIIQRLDKQFEGILMWFYEGLSEHAHPNYHGMLATYTSTKEEAGDDVAITRFTDRREGRKRATSIHVVSALAIAVDMVKSAVERYEDNRDAFAALAEQHIYELGTWPKSEPYPVKRRTAGDSPVKN